MDGKIHKSKYCITDELRRRAAENNPMRVSAPMVRYSKLAFRDLMRYFDTELCYTPMMMSDSFCQAQSYRDLEYSVPEDLLSDTPVIAQFAATDAIEFAKSAELVYTRGANGIDLNCGCPQRWAWQEGIGCKTTARKDWPEFIAECVKGARSG